MRRVLSAVVLAVLAVSAASAQVPAVPAYQTGRLHLTEESFNRAIQPYQQAIQANAQNARAHFWLGFAYSHAHHHYLMGAAPYAAGYGRRAVTSLLEAIKIAPNMTEAYAVLIDTYHRLGEHEKANDAARQALEKGRPGWLPATQFPPAQP
jgi:tetratricopeptide (TPR) repeat protein